MYNAWIDLKELTRHEEGQWIADTYMPYIEVPVGLGTKLLCHDSDGTTVEGVVVYIDKYNVVSILLQMDTLKEGL